MPPSCHATTLPGCHAATLPRCHTTTHQAAMLSCHHATTPPPTRPPGHHVTTLTCLQAAMPPPTRPPRCYVATLPCHHVTTPGNTNKHNSKFLGPDNVCNTIRVFTGHSRFSVLIETKLLNYREQSIPSHPSSAGVKSDLLIVGC